MYGERHNELVSAVAGLLHDMLPEGADRIVTTGTVDEDGSDSSLRFYFPSGESGFFGLGEMLPAKIELTDALFDLREHMVANGSEPWFGYTFTVHRRGDFDMDLSYTEPAG